MKAKVITAPAAYPVALATVKAHLEIASDDTSFDAELNRLIAEKTEEVEKYTGRALITRKYEFYSDAWDLNSEGVLVLPRPPVQSDEFAIEYYDADDALQTWSNSQYQLDIVSDEDEARVVPKSGYNFPVLSSRLNAVKITAKCGYGSSESSIPPGIVGAICVKIASRFALREDQVIGSIISEVDAGSAADRLLDDYRARYFA